MARKGAGTIEMQTIDCGMYGCSTRYSSTDTRSNFERWLRACGWWIRPGPGWICPKHKKEGTQ